MRALVFSAVILAASATTATAIPASFGLPHFVRVDQWPAPGVFRSTTYTSAKPVLCQPASAAARRCVHRDVQK